MDAIGSTGGLPFPWLDRPMSPLSCVFGWLLATALFLTSVGIWHVVGGVIGDRVEGVAPAVAIEHGALRCAYLPGVRSSVPPLFPLMAAGVMEITRVGANATVTSEAGSPCGSVEGKSVVGPESARDLLFIGLFAWPVLLGGFVALLRGAGRGRCLWEVVGACLLGCTPAVAATISDYFHPEDLLAMGLILAALAAAIRSRWITAGLCIGLAVCAKQYVLLAAIPLVVAAPRPARWRLVSAALATATVVLVPLRITMGRGLVDALTGAYATTTSSGTVVGTLHLHGVALLAASRLLPLVLAGALAVWARSRLKTAVCRPEALVALVATSLALRLAFETNLFSYYFMATSVSLIAVDFVVGRLRPGTIGWIVVSSALFPPAFLPPVLVTAAVPQLAQLALAGSGLFLAAAPLYRAMRAGSDPGRGTRSPDPAGRGTVAAASTTQPGRSTIRVSQIPDPRAT